MQAPAATAHNIKLSYLQKIRSLPPSTKGFPELSEALSKQNKNMKVVWQSSGLQTAASFCTPAQLLACSRKVQDMNPNGKIVCVIENISPECIEAIGTAWELDPKFFTGHAANPEREALWIRRSPPNLSSPNPGKKYEHLDGIFEYHELEIHENEVLDSSPNSFTRHCFIAGERHEGKISLQSSTRISYYRVRPELYLFLADAPLYIQNRYSALHRRFRPILRLMYARNRGGLLLPRLLEQEAYTVAYSLFESLSSVFQHGWQRDLLFSHGDPIDVFPGQPLLYFLASSLWQSNTRHLAKNIRKISFEEIRNPDANTNDSLHDLREDLDFLKTGLTQTIAYIPREVEDFFPLLPYYTDRAYHVSPTTPVDSFTSILHDAEALEKLVMETFSLLLSSIGVQEAVMSRDQARLSNQQALRATQLTLLASIYVPLSFVTGIFGMNLRELNGAGLSIWVFFVGIGIAAIVTAGIFWIISGWSKREAEKKLKP